MASSPLSGSKKDSPLAWLSDINWKSPIPYLTIVTAFYFLYAGGHFIKIGIALGCVMALSILILVHKAPENVRSWVRNYPLLADILFTGLLAAAVSSMFVAGLTLGIGTVLAGAILSFTLPAEVGKPDTIAA